MPNNTDVSDTMAQEQKSTLTAQVSYLPAKLFAQPFMCTLKLENDILSLYAPNKVIFSIPLEKVQAFNHNGPGSAVILVDGKKHHIAFEDIKKMETIQNTSSAAGAVGMSIKGGVGTAGLVGAGATSVATLHMAEAGEKLLNQWVETLKATGKVPDSKMTSTSDRNLMLVIGIPLAIVVVVIGLWVYFSLT